MLSKKLSKALGEQVNFEIYSSYIYLAMSSYLKSQGLNGFANWMKIQVQEELAHAMKFHDFILERGGLIEFESIPKPNNKWSSTESVFKAAYAHEQIVTGRINDLLDLALNEKDHATHAHLQWFITEQVEEEANVSEVLQQIQLFKDSPNGLYLLDKDLGQRVFVQPN